MGVFDIFKDDDVKIKVNVVGTQTQSQGKPGPAGIYKDGKLVWSPNSDPDGSPTKFPEVVKNPGESYVKISTDKGLETWINTTDVPLTWPKDKDRFTFVENDEVWSPEAKEGKIVFKVAPKGTTPSPVRTFDTGATRSAQADKLDFRGFLSPIALRAFAEYMHKNRMQPDGSVRASDNWQKGIPLQSYMESMWRHFFAVWEGHENGAVQDDDLAGLFFNVQGYMHEKGKL